MLALVTGGNKGIGFAIAKKLAESGVDVIIAARDKKKLNEAAKRLAALTKAKILAFPCDVTRKSDIVKLARLVSKVGQLDILVNDAGVAMRRNLAETEDAEIDAMIDVNLRGLIHCTKAFLPAMLERRRGVIINMASGAGKEAYPKMSVYCASKFGVVGFSAALGKEVAKAGVHVYSICPGATDTDMWHSLYPGEPADFTAEDVAIEVMEAIRHAGKLEPGSAIDVTKRG
jgi:3-oxoacyl-[acyl-carrier protein] reductase